MATGPWTDRACRRVVRRVATVEGRGRDLAAPRAGDPVEDCIQSPSSLTTESVASVRCRDSRWSSWSVFEARFFISSVPGFSFLVQVESRLS